jgi:hypothetical protein
MNRMSLHALGTLSNEQLATTITAILVCVDSESTGAK